MWTKQQKAEFAKQIIKQHFSREALPFMPPAVRRAIVGSWCFDVVRLQLKKSVEISEMDDLMVGVMAQVEKQMKNEDFFG